ncbi:MAG TPA: DUF748 domain-containing protein [Bacteriovoracaceae bacterium]|nr:DUF748 domain-containing protein [Bacteriovoracaceae bacterium]
MNTNTAAKTHFLKKKKFLIFIVLTLVFIVALRMSAPTIVESYLNSLGSDEKGYHFRISDLDLKVLKGKVLIKEINVLKKSSNASFLRIQNLEADFDWSEVFNSHKSFAVTGSQVDFTISETLIKEMTRVKNEAKKKIKTEIYLDLVTASFAQVNLQEIRKGSLRTILSLKEATARLRDFGFGDPSQKTEFEFNSAIKGGGKISLRGKTKLENKKMPWNIKGDLSGVTAKVIEKMAGDRLPLNIEEANFNADIVAWSNGGKISGHIIPRIKNLKLSEEKEEGFVKRNLAKAANFLFDKTKDDKKAVSLRLPFTLKENLTIDVPSTVDLIQAQESKD